MLGFTRPTPSSASRFLGSSATARSKKPRVGRTDGLIVAPAMEMPEHKRAGRGKRPGIERAEA